MNETLYTAAFTLTQGGADTSGEVTIATGLLPGLDLSAWELVALEAHVSATLVKAWAAADAHVIVQVTKRSLSAGYSTLTYADTDLISQYQMAAIASGTAANLQVIPTSVFLEFAPGTLLYSTAIYLQLMSAGTGQSNNVHGRILYRPRKLTQNEALAIVASRP